MDVIYRHEINFNYGTLKVQNLCREQHAYQTGDKKGVLPSFLDIEYENIFDRRVLSNLGIRESVKSKSHKFQFKCCQFEEGKFFMLNNQDTKLVIRMMLRNYRVHLKIIIRMS